MVADELDYVVGVDTHRDRHTLAVVAAPSGGVVAQRSVLANTHGYGEAVRFADQFAPGARVWAVEGAGQYGVGLVRHLSRQGETVLEGGRGPRQRTTAARQRRPARRSPCSTRDTREREARPAADGAAA
jgi:transposase